MSPKPVEERAKKGRWSEVLNAKERTRGARKASTESGLEALLLSFEELL